MHLSPTLSLLRRGGRVDLFCLLGNRCRSALFELVYASGSIEEVFFAGIERVAVAADFNGKRLDSGADLIDGTACASDFGFRIECWVGFFFHIMHSSIYSNYCKLQGGIGK